MSHEQAEFKTKQESKEEPKTWRDKLESSMEKSLKDDKTWCENSPMKGESRLAEEYSILMSSLDYRASGVRELCRTLFDRLAEVENKGWEINIGPGLIITIKKDNESIDLLNFPESFETHISRSQEFKDHLAKIKHSFDNAEKIIDLALK